MAPPLSFALTDLWFEPCDGASRLMAAVNLPVRLRSFDIELAGVTVRFRHVADIKGRRVFAASEREPAEDKDEGDGETLIRLAGPFSRSASDVA